MIEPSLSAPPLPPLLTRRVGVLGVLAFVLFGVVAFRLWYLQVLTGPQNVASRTCQRRAPDPDRGPRGEILDRHGNVLATTRGRRRASIVADDLPGGGRDPRRRPPTRGGSRSTRRLARVLGVTPGYIARDRRRQADPGLSAGGDPEQAQHLRALYLGEHPQRVPRRRRPAGQPALLSAGRHRRGRARADRSDLRDELGTSPFKGIQQGTYVGQAGLEATYQPYLQGKDGVEKVQVNASGVLTGKAPRSPRPSPGDTLLTSLDLGLEREGYIAVRRAESAAQAGLSHDTAPAGAFFAMDPNSGRVLALGSLPTYNANDFVTPPSTGSGRSSTTRRRRRSSTARSTRCIRPARRSSRSRRSAR